MCGKMKTVVKIDPEKEYSAARNILEDLSKRSDLTSDVSTLGSSVDNLKTVIDVLIERASPKKKSPPAQQKKSKRNPKKKREDFEKKPSERFPDLEIEEKISSLPEAPECPCCSKKMKESGLYKVSEKLEVIPKKYYIVRDKKVIYNCGNCYGSLINSPAAPSISKTSNYGDSVIIDAALTKYCDLIPMERYAAIAARSGVEGLPANSLIGLTHNLAHFLRPIYREIKSELLQSKVVMADETPHKMLEGDTTPNWFLWGFSSPNSCIFEAHPTRSGKVPLKFLSDSQAEYLLTDGYSGYKRSLSDLKDQGKNIKEAYCNAHALRYFKEAASTWAIETEPFLEIYGKIYKIEKQRKSDEPRTSMLPLFEELQLRAKHALESAMPHSGFAKALNYFLNHYDGLIVCVNDMDVPLDNNSSERLLRAPVVGRKIWYGNHSKRGAETSSILFSLVATCHLNNINPRHYFEWIVNQIHNDGQLLTPYKYSKNLESG